MLDLPAFRNDLHQIYSQAPELNRVPLEEILAKIPRLDTLPDLPPGTTVLIRIDLDMPIADGRVADLSRIIANGETVRYSRDRGWKTVLFGHLGRSSDISVRPVQEAMAAQLDMDIELIEDWLEPDNGRLADELPERVGTAPDGSVFMLQNTRKYALERALWDLPEADFDKVCRRLYSVASDVRERLTKVEINESIAGSNIDFSSSVVPLVMKHTALGFFIESEFSNHVVRARNSNCVVFSGLKMDKLNELEHILERGKLDLVIVAGALAMALVKARARLRGADWSIGRGESDPSYKGFVSAKRLEQATRILRLCSDSGVELVLPEDFVLDDGSIGEEVPMERTQLDIGPRSRRLFEQTIRRYIERARESPGKSVMFYNGVFGMFEKEQFEAGTRSFIPLLKEMTAAGIETFVGGGEGRLALQKYGSLEDVTHAFTCGGTILKSLTDRHIAYLKAMYLQNCRHDIG